jgi:pSer/pThr/pTyr-binding forkhead associated (FHA) protein
MSAQVILEVVRGKLLGQTFTFRKRSLCLVGRAEGCQIRLPNDADHRGVSRHHCLIDVDPPEVRVRDFGSRNGTFVNGKNIGQRAADTAGRNPDPGQFPPWELHEGDELRIGRTAFRVRVSFGEDTPAPDSPVGPLAGALCSRCGRRVPLPLDTINADSILCLACRQNPRRLAEDLIKQADSGSHQLALIQGYKLLDELGRGDTSAVYLAQNSETGDRVALKVMFPRGAADPRTRQRFLREAHNTVVLRHPNIVHLRDAGWFRGVFYFTLEYCEGGTVARWMQELGRPLTVDEAAPLILQTLDALDYCHNVEVPFVPHEDGEWAPGSGLVHRDVKPANLFLTGSGSGLCAKLGDFGLSKAFDKAGLSGHTWSGLLSGTPLFMPRQQVLRYKYARPEVDVWATAATFYFMLTGTSARDFSRGNGWMEVILETPAVPIRCRLSSLPTRLADVLDTALIDRPEIPFKTAAAFRESLQAVL